MFGRKNKFGFYALWFVVGGIVGSALALLFAPMTGKKMQKQVKEVIDDQVDNIQTVVRKIKSA
ncbi:MAG TPA: YtxH domain-containing protein [Thermoanaerobaculia bacterium]|nr:YtxH domain-containing protein [Thermoanaerobaculia bacterium]